MLVGKMETNLFSREENIGFWKNLLLSVIFFTIAPLTIGVSLFSLFSLSKSAKIQADQTYPNLFYSPQSGIQVYASLPTQTSSISAEVGAADARGQIIKQYLTEYDSPLAPFSDFIVQTADKYGLDFRLITAIAQQESNVCKIIPPGSYNCWGWGITNVGTLGFNSYQQGIEEVSKGLREDYLNKGYVTIEDIMGKYTPQSKGSWAAGVTEFMSEMQ